MNGARVKRTKGPASKMTEATYRKKALRHLLEDFSGHCAYCLDPNDFRHPSQDHVDHFDCNMKGRERHYYKNLMLACAACNRCKWDKPVTNPLDKTQHLLNCTEVSEFPDHIFEDDDGQWIHKTPPGYYHLASIGLQEQCHKNKRKARKAIANRIAELCQSAVVYQADTPGRMHNSVMLLIRDLLETLRSFPPLVTANGVVTVTEWLGAQGVDTALFLQYTAPPPVSKL